MVGLLLFALATGSMKPCVVALGGDQYKLPEQTKHMGQFYSISYATSKLTYLIASALTPILRNDVKCFGTEFCFPLAFAVLGVFVLISFGKRLLKLLHKTILICTYCSRFHSGQWVDYQERSNRKRGGAGFKVHLGKLFFIIY